MRRTAAVIALLLLQASVAMPAVADQALNRQCGISEELASAGDMRLPQLASAIRQRKPVHIVVLGSGSSAALPGLNRTVQSYATRLQAEITRLFPGIAVTVSNKSARGQTASQMLSRMVPEVLPEQPQLVVWQTGTTDAVSHVDVNQFGATLHAGLATLAAGNIDVVLVTPQFSRRTSAMVDFDAYDDYMGWAASGGRALLFPRYAIMQYWADTSFIEIDRGDGDLAGTAERMHDCLARLLAEMIASAVRTDLNAGGAARQ